MQRTQQSGMYTNLVILFEGTWLNTPDHSASVKLSWYLISKKPDIPPRHAI